MIDYIMKGGVIMIPIVLCSVLALGIILERLWRLRWKRSLRYDLLNRIEELLREQKTPEATTLCKRHPSIMTRMLTVSELLIQAPDDLASFLRYPLVRFLIRGG
jgi:biopolymer transport protein ExbB